MPRKVYTKAEDDWLVENYNSFETVEKLKNAFNNEFLKNKTKAAIYDRCYKKMNLKRKNDGKFGNKVKEQLPIGTIRKSQTMTYIKMLDVPIGTCFSGYCRPYWIPLQEKIYCENYGHLEKGYFVCFLDGDNTNFDIDNLYAINRKISATMSKSQWWSSDRDLTLAGIKYWELYYAKKEVE